MICDKNFYTKNNEKGRKIEVGERLETKSFQNNP